jgi:hypothetical protein
MQPSHGSIKTMDSTCTASLMSFLKAGMVELEVRRVWAWLARISTIDAAHGNFICIYMLFSYRRLKAVGRRRGQALIYTL